MMISTRMLRLAKSEFLVNEDGLRAAVTVERVDGLNGSVSSTTTHQTGQQLKVWIIE